MATTTPGTTDPIVGQPSGVESSLSNWAGPYVTEMLGRGAALADMQYQPYYGPLTAGPSELQQKGFDGIGSIDFSSMVGGYDPRSFTGEGIADLYMSPYIQQALNPQLDEARRQAEITRLNDASRLTKAGAFGGSRQAIMESENNRNLGQNLAAITGKGYQDAFESARNQFNTEEALRLNAAGQNTSQGLQGIQALLGAGDTQRQIEAEGIAADKKQFEEERDYPFKQVQFMQSLLQGLPLATQSYTYNEPSNWSQFLGGAGGIMELINSIFK